MSVKGEGEIKRRRVIVNKDVKSKVRIEMAVEAVGCREVVKE
jgi:hypothetical protein